ncbi:acyl-CoA dehydrogenase family protein [Antrihabitans cavernicola]|uniref:Acyl-CoA dehydrogenase n=1 Tax=Antrihabitans cavernicola TaxID=2495913 RepID=A0A5A7S7W7_9NOCA|nr:acyl-CoA dehydrogenase family protein [Spelaeibacter cavernicola]KAA0022006.1 acyl-CoA dehydrogenase [Spelaeibacter cavernicola]
MDFTRDQTQDAVAEAAAGLLEKAAEQSAEQAWSAVSSLSELALPERLGGDGVGLTGVATLLTEIGRTATQVPALATLGFGVLPLLALADESVQDEILPQVADGAVLTAGLGEPGKPFVADPATTAIVDGDSIVVTGTKIAVPYAQQALRILVPTDTGVVLVAPDADGVRLTQTPSSSGAPEFAVRLDGVRVPRAALLPGDPAVLLRIALASIGASADGLVSGAAALTAEHLRTRHQFGKPLATFQAVAQQIADVYVTSRTLHVSALASAWRLSESLDADSDLDVLAYWIASEVPAAMQVCHHLHGGLGVDITYPMHRYYSQTKDLARLVGGAAYRLDLLGARCSSI